VIDRVGFRGRIDRRASRRRASGQKPPTALSRRRVLGLLAGAALVGIGDHDTVAKSRKGQKIVREARKHIGDQYVAGGTGPDSFDCSGFTYFVVKKALGQDISPALQSQTSVGRSVRKNQRRKGDLIFFSLEGGRQVTHVAIVINDTRIIHAMNPQDGVKVSDMTSPYYMDNIRDVRRL
jgi:cell wall-associated NlpC family hydrolase